MTVIERLVEQYCISFVRERAQDMNSACPVARVNPEFSPERIAIKAEEDAKGLVKSSLIWECLTCGLCRHVTGGRVDMSGFVRDLREKAARAGCFGTETHGGMLFAAERLNARSALKPNRTDWITDPLRVRSKTGHTLYWVGGAPFFAATFRELKPTALDSAKAAIRLLNRVGVEPVVLKEERFSGHDLLWTGNTTDFRSLAEQNIRAIKQSRAKVVIVSSPEDYHTLTKSYGEYLGDVDFEVCHITEFMADRLSDLNFSEWPHRIAYHDPCRLGRGMDVYDAPRDILRAIPGLELVEMKNTREFSACCGTSCWTNCNRYSKLMQINRLREAADVGAETVVTTCWECAIHFQCATRPEAWRQVAMDVKDLILLAESLAK
jgi:heterodisulfide reductase subunit D